MHRAVLSILLSLVLLVTSHSAAVARGAPHAVDQMVICSGTTVVVVYVDAEGQPITAPHLCPDCALHLLATVSPPGAVPIPLYNSMQLRRQIPVERREGIPVVETSARAPPVSI